MIDEDVVIGSAFLIIFLFLLYLLAFFSGKEEKEFKEWASKNCKVIGYIQGKTRIGIGTGYNGYPSPVMVPESDKTGYQCDDGMQYWR